MKTQVWMVGAVLCVATGTVTASTIEEQTGVCYQNDGQINFATHCDFPDTAEQLLASASPAACNTDVEVDSGRTSGTLVSRHGQPGVPEEDPADFCLAAINPVIPTGSLVSVDLDFSQFNVGSSFPMSLHVYDPATGEELGTAASSGGNSIVGSDGPLATHSGSSTQSFHPVSVSEVSVDGVPSTAFARSTTQVGVLDFVVKNDPQTLTVDGTEYSLHVGDAVRLCQFDGELFFALTALGGNIKFDGTADAIAFAVVGETMETCASLLANVECTSEEGLQNTCTFTSTPAMPNLVFEIRSHMVSTPEGGVPGRVLTEDPREGLISTQPHHCHDACLGEEGPNDWLTILEVLGNQF